MRNTSIEVSVRGEWLKVQALEVGGSTLVLTGRQMKVASVHDEEWLTTSIDNPAACIEELKKRPRVLKADLFTFAQRLPDTTPRYDYPMEWDSIAAIDLKDPRKWWEDKLPQETRKNVRRAAKRGVVVRVEQFNDELIQGIVEINNESSMRQGRRFYHYGKSADEVRRDYSSFHERSEFICAYCGSELIGFIQVIYMDGIAGILEILTKRSHYDKRPANALLARAVEQCAGRGARYLTYGKYNYGKRRNNELTEFKRRNGFDEILVPRYFVPLTAKGKICTAFRLHHGLAGFLPDPLIDVLAGLRRILHEYALSRMRNKDMRGPVGV
jgi:hypothetical protein